MTKQDLKNNGYNLDTYSTFLSRKHSFHVMYGKLRYTKIHDNKVTTGTLNIDMPVVTPNKIRDYAVKSQLQKTLNSIAYNLGLISDRRVNRQINY